MAASRAHERQLAKVRESDREWMESVSRDENTLDADRQSISRRGAVLGILIPALIVGEVIAGGEATIACAIRGICVISFSLLTPPFDSLYALAPSTYRGDG